MNMLWHIITNPKAYLQSIGKERAIISNWQDILILKLFNKPVFLYLKSGKSVPIKNWKEYRDFRSSDTYASEYALFLNKKHPDLDLVIGDKSVRFRMQDRRVVFYYVSLVDAVSLIDEQFVCEQYKWLNVKGKKVIDIGANIGDTSIYFALKGAKQSYGFEPFPSVYAISKKNVKSNNLQNKITLLNEGCGGKQARIRISDKYKSTTTDTLREFRSGKEIHITTLNDIVKRFGITDGVLKMDTEGSEYPIILSASIKTLRCFDQMLIEYHDYPKRLEDKLKLACFNISRKEIFQSKQGQLFVSRIENSINKK